jgi:chromosome segregation ATPase
LQPIGRVGGSRGGNRGAAGSVKFATTNYDIDERATGPIIDRKFEGHSELAQAADKIKKL